MEFGTGAGAGGDQEVPNWSEEKASGWWYFNDSHVTKATPDMALVCVCVFGTRYGMYAVYVGLYVWADVYVLCF